MTPEPTLNVADIQGNILAGFNKDFQSFLFLRIRAQDSDVTAARQWIKNTLAPKLATMEQVLAFNRAFRNFNRGLGPQPAPATFINVGFSAACLRRIVSDAAVDAFADDAFKIGMGARSEFLGDPSDSAAAGNKRNWVVGGTPEKAVDIMVIVASDDGGARETAVDELLATFDGGKLDLVFRQDGATLPAGWAGHEHFGFKDGVSQPGVRGRDAIGDITERRIDAADPRSKHFAKPGQPLLWPGEFVLGEKRQRQGRAAPDTPRFELDEEPDDPIDLTGIPWALNGSYIAVRRLRQDYGKFWAFASAQAQRFNMTPEAFASRLVGRWPSGAPIMRTPAADDPNLADDPMAVNHFAFSRDSAAHTISGYTDSFPMASADFLGKVCPHYAHIRKVNPRDEATDLGVAHDTGARAILRRGIPYGESLLDVASPTPEQLAADRGLMFVCYQASIVNQFEVLIRRWTNNSVLPRPGGHDPVIGQTERHGGVRRRFIDDPDRGRIFIDEEWVIPTGGEYFFAPSISAVRATLGA